MKAISLVGYKKTGKTSLAVALCKELQQRDISVSVAKMSHHSFDKGDSDTEKLSQYADSVAGLTEEETMLFWPRKRYLPDLLPLIQSDVLIIEGGKHLDYVPRVLLLNSSEEFTELHNDLTLAVWGTQEIAQVPNLTEISSLADLVLEKGFFLPGLDCGSCGREGCGQLAQEIVAGQADPDDCQALQTDFDIKLNGQSLAMNHFVRDIIAGAIQGMLGNLKGYAPGSVIDIHMEK
jgi:molybdopterin-guanine dinucleotide biosynthesis protein B